MNKSWITLGEPQRSFYPQQKLKEFRKKLVFGELQARVGLFAPRQ